MCSIENYSEKAIAVFGNTKDFKDVLLSLGGKFNNNLRGKQGWIFPKNKEAEVKQVLLNNKGGSVEEDFEEDEPVSAPKLKRLLGSSSSIISQSVLRGDPQGVSQSVSQGVTPSANFQSLPPSKRLLQSVVPKRLNITEPTQEYMAILQKLESIENKLDKFITMID